MAVHPHFTGEHTAAGGASPPGGLEQGWGPEPSLPPWVLLTPRSRWSPSGPCSPQLEELPGQRPLPSCWRLGTLTNAVCRPAGLQLG